MGVLSSLLIVKFQLIWFSTVIIYAFELLLSKQQRRGVVDGIDYRETGEVRRLDVARIKKRLDDNCIVILSNLGYSSAGEVLNCKYVCHFCIVYLVNIKTSFNKCNTCSNKVVSQIIT